MKLPRRKFLHLAAGAAALPALPRIARAQSYPSRPVTIVVPYAPGGPTDAVARIIAERMRASLAQPVVVENISGGNGGIGTTRVARAVPDGYTVGLGAWNTHVANPALYSLSFDVLKDFEPISLLVSYPLVIVAGKSTTAKNLQELIVWLKANPEKVSQGIAGVGSGGHLTGVLFQKLTGARFQHVPYRGSGPAMQDLVAGQTDMMIDSPNVVLPLVRAGTIKAYAVTSTSRLTVAPDIPTVDEAGSPGLYFLQWQALFAPKDTPKSVIAKLNAAVMDVLADAAVRQRLADLGFEIPRREQQTPEALAAFHRAETEKWWPIIKAANIKAE